VKIAPKKLEHHPFFEKSIVPNYSDERLQRRARLAARGILKVA